jgi:tetratricopeptide (TPR) repeat protein
MKPRGLIPRTLAWADRRPRQAAFLLSIVLHMNSVRNGIVWDDRAAVTYNSDVATGPDYLNHDYWGQPMAAPDSHKSWRPLATWSFRMNYLVHGYAPLGYHLVNVLIHACSCALVLSVARNAFRKDEMSARLATLVFVVHPTHSEPVASVVGRADVLGGFLALFAIVLYQRGGFSAMLAFVVALLASLAKEVGIATFALFVAFDVIDVICSSPSLTKALKRLTKSKTFIIRSAAALTGVLGVLWLHTRRHGQHLLYKWTLLENSVAADLADDRLATYLTYAHFHWRYFIKLITPAYLCYDYGYPCLPHIHSIKDKRNAYPAALYLFLLYFIYEGLARKKRHVLLALALGLVPFLPAAHVLLPVGTPVGERLLYLPSVGFSIGVAALCRYLRVDEAKSSAPDANDAFYASIIPSRGAVSKSQKLSLLAALCLGSLRTVDRNTAWSSERSLFEASLDVCPRSLKILNNLALVLLNGHDEETIRQRDLPRARALLDDALSTYKGFPSALFNRGLVHHLEDRRVAAARDFADALTATPGGTDQRIETYLGQELWLLAKPLEFLNDPKIQLLRMSLIDLAADHIQRGDPELPLTHWAAASIAFERDDFEAAEISSVNAWNLSEQYRERGEHPDRWVKADACLNLIGLARRGRKDDQGALVAFEACLERVPGSSECLANAASILSDQGGDDQRTADFYERAMQVAPDSPEVLNNYGFFLETRGRVAEALEKYEKAAQLLLPAVHHQINTNIKNARDRLARGDVGVPDAARARPPPPPPEVKAAPAPPRYTWSTKA